MSLRLVDPSTGWLSETLCYPPRTCRRTRTISEVKADHLGSSADQVTTDEHATNPHALLQQLHAAERFLGHPRK
jgi:hypothetical protein